MHPPAQCLRKGEANDVHRKTWVIEQSDNHPAHDQNSSKEWNAPAEQCDSSVLHGVTPGIQSGQQNSHAVSLDSSSLQKSDKVIFDFTSAAISDPAVDSAVDDGLASSLSYAIEFVAYTKPSDLIAAREGIMCMIEERAAELVSNGSVAEWMAGSEPLVAKVSETVNGPLFQELAKATNFTDSPCVDFFRHGAPFIGKLDGTDSNSPQELKASTLESNRAVCKNLSCDPFATEMLAQVQADAALPGG
jgi:hypothetical protein